MNCLFYFSSGGGKGVFTVTLGAILHFDFFSPLLALNKVRLRTLDVSSNKLSFLDVGIRHMTSLVELNVQNNPLVFPPAKVNFYWMVLFL